MIAKITSSTLATGLIRGEPNETYHAADAWSKTKLDVFRELPLLAFKRFVEKSITDDFDSAALRIGSAADCLILEGLDAYAERYVIVPPDAPRKPSITQREAKKPSEDTVKAIEWWDQFHLLNARKTILSAEDNNLAGLLNRAVWNQETARALLEQGEPQLTFRVKTDRYHLQCRPDWFNPSASSELVAFLRGQKIAMDVGEPYVCELKTVASLSDLAYRNFAKNFANFGYHRSGPFYTSVIRDVIGKHVTKFFFIVVEKEAPHGCAVFLADDESQRIGWEEIVNDVQALNRCYDSDIWPGVPTNVQTVSLPGWYLKKHDSEEQEAA